MVLAVHQADQDLSRYIRLLEGVLKWQDEQALHEKV